MSDDLPFRAEYAKSGRASCKACKSPISKDSLRLAKMVQSQSFDGKQPHWFHYECFFGKNKVKSLEDIAGVDGLRWDDQEKIKSIFGGGASASNSATSFTDGLPKDFQVEYAKSSRSKCKDCEAKIEKSELRVAIMVEGDAKFTSQKTPNWHHVPCFSNMKKAVSDLANLSENDFDGFTLLQDADKDKLRKELGLAKPSKKVKQAIAIIVEPPKSADLMLKEQNDTLWTLRDELQRNLTTSMVRGMLEANCMSAKGGEADLFDRCADAMMFGVPTNCPECKNGTLNYRSNGYKCAGNLSGWTKCLYTTKDPSRVAWIITDDQKEQSEFLEKFKPKVEVRLFPKSTKDLDIKKPFAFKKVLLSGKLNLSKSEITTKIEQLGGMVVKTVANDLFCCISSPADIQKMSKKIQTLQQKGIPIVSEDFLVEVKYDNVQAMFSKHELVPTKAKLDSLDGYIAKRKLASPQNSGFSPKKTKLKLKGGAVVDPDSELDDVAHVYREQDEIYTAVLGMVDLSKGTNSYYKLQLLEHDISKKYHLFRSWGRVGTAIGGSKVEPFYDIESAIESFIALFEEKTGNSWYTRKDFVKHPYKFYPLDMDYGEDDDNLQKMQSMAGTNSKLPVQVQELVKMIFDVESMKKTMAEFEIDLTKMPLGKLSRKQIEKSYKILGELQQYIENKESASKFLDASNRFYTLIPHDFGMKMPPLLNTTDLIKAKMEMLESLLDIEVAYSLLQSNAYSDKDPLDVHYESLKTDIKVLDRELDEFKNIQDYVKNTHADTHKQYGLDVLEVFNIERQGEKSRYSPFKELHNRKLLWHGSRTSNYAGIISQGLRIAPPEAPVTGYMFGKGLYFADMVSKSANYCRSTPRDNIGLLLICEVALGNMYELTNAKSITKLPKGKHSCKGCGRTEPDPSMDIPLPDGAVLPMGTGAETDDKNSALLYNEYIVYDAAQVQMKYLLKVKFNYEY